ncbi:MAG: hypothetical protein JNK82_45355 [Myxococcaceae bacterium]|nr:hypothetical protein [Myxococcaceae bacterium]
MLTRLLVVSLLCAACPKREVRDAGVPAPAPTIEQFGVLLETELRRRFPNDTFAQEPAQRRIAWKHAGDAGLEAQLNLENFYAEWNQQGAPIDVIADRVSVWLDDSAGPIVPGLRQRITVELAGRLSRGEGRLGKAPYAPVSETVAIALFHDRKGTMTYVTNDELAKLGTPFGDALDAGTAVLLSREPPPVEELTPGVWSFHGDDWTTAHFVLGKLYARLPVNGAPLAAFVSKTRVVMTGDAEAGRARRCSTRRSGSQQSHGASRCACSG